MAPFLALEVGSVAAYGWGWARDPTNLLDLFTYTLQIGIMVTHLARIFVASQWLTYAMAVQCIRATRFSFPTMVRQVLSDIGWVLVFVFLVCVAFGAAIHITFRQDENAPEEFDSFPRSVLSMFEHAYGDLELKSFLNSRNPVFGTGLALSYILIMG